MVLLLLQLLPGITYTPPPPAPGTATFQFILKKKCLCNVFSVKGGVSGLLLFIIIKL